MSEEHKPLPWRHISKASSAALRYIDGRRKGEIKSLDSMLILTSNNEFDENIFLYGEDNDLCCRMIEKGYLIIFASNAQGTHLVSKATTSTFRIRWRKEWNIVWSHLYLVKKYENLEAAQFRAKRLLIKHAPKVLFYAIIFLTGRIKRVFKKKKNNRFFIIILN